MLSFEKELPSSFKPQTLRSATNFNTSGALESGQVRPISELWKNSSIVEAKDYKIKKISEKLKTAEKQLGQWKQRALTAEYQLIFFKQKIQQQFARYQTLQEEISKLNFRLRRFVDRIIQTVKNDQQVSLSLTTFLEQPPNCGDSLQFKLGSLEECRKSADSLEFQISQVSKSLLLLRQQPKKFFNLYESAQIKIKQMQSDNKKQKKTLKNQISQLLKTKDKRPARLQISGQKNMKNRLNTSSSSGNNNINYLRLQRPNPHSQGSLDSQKDSSPKISPVIGKTTDKLNFQPRNSEQTTKTFPTSKPCKEQSKDQSQKSGFQNLK